MHSYREEKCERHVTMVALFLDDNKTNGDGKENGEKNNVYINKQQLLNVRHAIFYISLPSLHHYDMKPSNFTSPRYGVGEHNTKIFAFFLKYHKELTSLTNAFHPRVYSL